MAIHDRNFVEVLRDVISQVSLEFVTFEIIYHRNISNLYDSHCADDLLAFFELSNGISWLLFTYFCIASCTQFDQIIVKAIVETL